MQAFSTRKTSLRSFDWILLPDESPNDTAFQVMSGRNSAENTCLELLNEEGRVALEYCLTKYHCSSHNDTGEISNSAGRIFAAKRAHAFGRMPEKHLDVNLLAPPVADPRRSKNAPRHKSYKECPRGPTERLEMKNASCKLPHHARKLPNRATDANLSKDTKCGVENTSTAGSSQPPDMEQRMMPMPPNGRKIGRRQIERTSCCDPSDIQKSSSGTKDASNSTDIGREGLQPPGDRMSGHKGTSVEPSPTRCSRSSQPENQASGFEVALEEQKCLENRHTFEGYWLSQQYLLGRKRTCTVLPINYVDQLKSKRRQK